jgi:hypothetical protein
MLRERYVRGWKKDSESPSSGKTLEVKVFRLCLWARVMTNHVTR